jgi:hypothetical protein
MNGHRSRRGADTPATNLHTWRDAVALSRPILALGRVLTVGAELIRTRRSRPWLGMVAVPLAMLASMLRLLWWCWPPLIAVAWWFADRRWRWTWLVAVEAGVDGTPWAYAGAMALGSFPNARLIVAAIWIGLAVLLLAASVSIRHGNREAPPRFPGY